MLSEPKVSYGYLPVQHSIMVIPRDHTSDFMSYGAAADTTRSIKIRKGS